MTAAIQEKSERERRAPLFRDEINKGKKKVHTYFASSREERLPIPEKCWRECRWRAGWRKRTDCREGGQRGNGTVRRAQQPKCSMGRYEKCANDERREQRSTGGTGLLAFEGKQQNQTGVNKKDQDAEITDGHQIEVAAQGRSVLEVEQEVKKNNGENGAGSEEVQVRAFRSGVQR
jgi:hypothetical protein